jgi:hypothetical protein
MLQRLYTYVANICPHCFICFFRHMLQVCLSGSCICFTHMLQMFLFGCCICVAKFFKCFHVFLQVFQTHVSNISFVFRRTLHLLHLDVSKLDRVLHLPPRLCVVSPRWSAGRGRQSPLAWGGPYGLAGAADEMWVGRRGTWDGGSDVGIRALATPFFFIDFRVES